MELREIRRGQQFSQKSVANAAGISRAAYANIENGKRRPSPKVAKRIGGFLGFDWTRFYDDERKEGKGA